MSRSPIDLTPEEFRALGYKAVDLIAAQIANHRERTTRQPVPHDLRDALMHMPLNDEPADASQLIEDVAERILAYPMGNNSPRFFSWINSPVAPMGIIAEMIAAAHNASVAGGDHSATYVEHGVLNWFKEWFHFPQDAGGLLVSGGSMANIIGLAVMRHVKTGGSVRKHGLSEQGRMTIYTSTQGHGCIQKAIELLGFGDDALRRIAVDVDFQIDVDALAAKIAEDRANGFIPVCVAISVGTVNTGAIDPINAVADLCEREGLWLHVDGAYGAVGILAPQVTHLYAGIERVDSLAVDPHKWLYVPIECGVALVKDAQAMRDTFAVMPPYLRDDRQLPWFSEFGVQQTRGFRALKLWLVLQQVGLDGYRQLLQNDIDRSYELRAKIEEREGFELVAAGPLSICTFVYAPNPASDVDQLQRDIATHVQASGEAFITTTMIHGRTVLRACIVNFRTTEADLDRLLDAVVVAAQEKMMVEM